MQSIEGMKSIWIEEEVPFRFVPSPAERFFPEEEHFLSSIHSLLPHAEQQTVMECASRLKEKISQAFQSQTPVELEVRFSKKEPDGLGFTVYVRRNKDEGFDCHFIPNSKDVCVVEGEAKTKPSLFLSIPKWAHANSLAPEQSMYSRLKPSKIDSFLQGLEIHKKVLKQWGSNQFAPIPILHEPTEKGKLGLRNPPRDESLDAAFKKNFSSRVDSCLSIAKGVELLGKMEPAVIHGGIRLSHILLQDNLAKIMNFDLAKYSGSEQAHRDEHYFASVLSGFKKASPKSDLYSLAILIGKALIPRFMDQFQFIFGQNDLAQCLDGSSLQLSAWASCKQKLSLEVGKKAEELFLEEDSIEEMALYAKSLKNSPDFAVFSEFVLQCAVFQSAFEIVFKALQEEEKARQHDFEGRCQKQITETYSPYSAEEIQGLLQKAKAKVDLLKGFWEGELEKEALQELQEETHRSQDNPMIFSSGLKKILTAPFVEKVKDYLRFLGEKNFAFSFKENDPKGLMGQVPFSGALQKKKDGLYIYINPPTKKPMSEKESYRPCSNASFLFIPNNESKAEYALEPCLYSHLNPSHYRFYQEERLSSLELDKMKADTSHLAFPSSPPIFDSLGKGAYLYDISSSSTLDKKKKFLSTEEKITIGLDLVRAVKFLHENNLVHGLIHPKNIHLKEREQGFSVKLSDCSLLRTPCFSWKQTSKKMGEFLHYPAQVGFFSKEQDLHALLCTLHQMFFEKWIDPSMQGKYPDCISRALNCSLQENLYGDVHQLFNKEGFSIDFSKGLLDLAKKNPDSALLLKEFAFDFYIYSEISDTLNSVLEVDRAVRKHIEEKYQSRFHPKAFTMPVTFQEWEEILKEFALPQLEEIEGVLLCCKQGVEELIASMTKMEANHDRDEDL
jgi:hypothetical protein